jgi:hypothetical protein
MNSTDWKPLGGIDNVTSLKVSKKFNPKTNQTNATATKIRKLSNTPAREVPNEKSNTKTTANQPRKVSLDHPPPLKRSRYSINDTSTNNDVAYLNGLSASNEFTISNPVASSSLNGFSASDEFAACDYDLDTTLDDELANLDVESLVARNHNLAIGVDGEVYYGDHDDDELAALDIESLVAATQNSDSCQQEQGCPPFEEEDDYPIPLSKRKAPPQIHHLESVTNPGKPNEQYYARVKEKRKVKVMPEYTGKSKVDISSSIRTDSYESESFSLQINIISCVFSLVD